MKRIAFDLDGVLADFESAYKKAATELIGFTDFKDEWDLGMPKEMASECLDKMLETNPGFWMSLNRLFSCDQEIRIRRLTLNNEVYFITSRRTYPRGLPAQRQSAYWALNNGLIGSVIVTKEKGRVCDVLGITHFIDDRIDFCNLVRAESSATNTYLMDAPWNRKDRKDLDSEVRVVKNLDEFLNDAEA